MSSHSLKYITYLSEKSDCIMQLNVPDNNESPWISHFKRHQKPEIIHKIDNSEAKSSNVLGILFFNRASLCIPPIGIGSLEKLLSKVSLKCHFGGSQIILMRSKHNNVMIYLIRIL